MNLDRKDIIRASILGAAVLFFVLAIWLPMRTRQSLLRAQITDIHTTSHTVRPRADQITGLRRTVDELGNNIRRTKQHILRDAKLAALFSDLNALIDAYALNDSKIEQLNRIEGPDYNTVPVTLNFTASFEDVFSFIRQVEAMDRLIRITRLQIKLADHSAAPNGTILATIRMDTFSSAGRSR